MDSYWFDRADEMKRKAEENPSLADLFNEFQRLYVRIGYEEQGEFQLLSRPSLIQRLKSRVGLF